MAAILNRTDLLLAQTSSSKIQLPATTLADIPAGSSQVQIPNKIQTLVIDQDLFGIKLYSSSIDSSNLEAQYIYNALRGLQTSSVKFIAGLYPESDISYVALPEAYYSNIKKLNEYQVEIDYTLGRKQTINSYLDHEFNLGLVNPYFSQDHINYTSEGLIGLHTSVGNEKLKIGVNYYPIFTPNQGPMVTEKNGKIKEANRWSQEAPETFLYNGKENSITYTIDDYNLYDLMSQSGYSVSLQSGDIEKNNIELDVTYSNTPINDIILSRTVIADLNLNGSVKIYPVVRYSDKITSDIQYKQNNLTYFASYLFESPRNQLEKEDRAVQVLESVYGYGGGVQMDFNSWANRKLSVGASYGRFFGGQIIDTDSDGKTNAFNISNQRLIFQQPYKLNLGVDTFRMLSSPVHFDMSWTYDGLQRGSLLSIKTSHRPLPRMNVTLGFDVIGISDETNSENKKTFLGQHSADDRVTGALEYVF